LGSSGALEVREFPAKILMFGEYTVINGGMGLAIPYPAYTGHWSQGPAPHYDWNSLLRFLKAHAELEVNISQLEQDLQNGAGYISTIPQGKGLGSSGALVASIFDYYSAKKDRSLSEVKACLSTMEGFYHGQSSGIDPLVSWLNRPLLLDENFHPQIVDLPIKQWSELRRWFLLDSDVARSSAPLIAVFRQKMQELSYKERLMEINEVVKEIIEEYEHLNEALVGHLMLTLSQMQFEFFREMIPAKLHSLWAEGIKSRQYALKLCGAGGGGFFIGYRLRELPSMNAVYF
jgi:mevalonate kinase